jgi:hypothetical protein
VIPPRPARLTDLVEDHLPGWVLFPVGPRARVRDTRSAVTIGSSSPTISAEQFRRATLDSSPGYSSGA